MRLTRRRFLQGMAAVGVAIAGGIDLGVHDDQPGIPFGASAGTEPFPNVNSHFVLERQIGSMLPTMLWFIDWNTNWLQSQGDAARDTGHNVLLSWQPKIVYASISFADILAGKWDDYIRGMFTSIANSGVQVTIRPMQEMNGNYFPWSVGAPHAGVTSTDQWIAMWRYLVDQQRSIGGDIRWNWCVNYADGGGDSIAAEHYWPGDDVVDIVGIDLYNGIGSAPWASPADIVQAMLARMRALAPGKPIWFPELGCREATEAEQQQGFSKAAWFGQLGDFITANTIENTCLFDEGKWNLMSSPQSFQAAKALVANTRL